MKATLSLKKSTDFQKILKKGTWYSSDLLSVYVMKNNKNINFLGIAVGKKGLNSVERNRIKRLIRETYRKIECNLNLGYNIVILWKSKNDFSVANYSDIYLDINKCFKKAKIII